MSYRILVTAGLSQLLAYRILASKSAGGLSLPGPRRQRPRATVGVSLVISWERLPEGVPNNYWAALAQLDPDLVIVETNGRRAA